MRFLFFLLFAFAGISSANADSVDVYQVFLRGKSVGSFTEGHTVRVVMKRDSISTFDTLKVRVSRDAPCSDCQYSLLVFGAQGPMLIDTLQNSQSFFVPMAPLAEHSRKNGTKVFHGYYTEFFGTAARSRVISFEIRLE